MLRTLPVCLAGGLLFFNAVLAAAQSVTFHSIATVGQAAPGGGTFASIDKWEYNANSHGVVAFSGTTDAGAGLWKWSSGTFQLIAREGDPATELGAGFTFGGFLSPSVNGNGAVGFISGVGGASVNETNSMAVWTAGSLGLHAVAHGGSSTPGIASIAPLLMQTRLNSSGQMTVHQLIGTTSSAIWFGSGGTFNSIAAAGQPQPIRPGNFTYVGAPQLSETGQTLWGATEAPGKNVLWSYSGGTFEVLAGDGIIMPDVAGELFAGDRFGGSSLAPNGHIAFVAGSQSGDVNGIWSRSPGQSTQLLARNGEAAPGTSSTFLAFTNLRVNSSGTVAFTGIVDELGGVVYHGKVGSALRPVLMNGQLVPEMSGYQFSADQTTFQIDDAGNTVLQSVAMLPGDFDSQTQGLWISLAGGDLLKLLVVGQPVMVDGTPHVVEEFTWASDYAASNYLTDGLPPIWAKFTDGSSGIFVVTVPEPRLGMAITLAAATLLRRNRNRPPRQAK